MAAPTVSEKVVGGNCERIEPLKLHVAAAARFRAWQVAVENFEHQRAERGAVDVAVTHVAGSPARFSTGGRPASVGTLVVHDFILECCVPFFPMIAPGVDGALRF